MTSMPSDRALDPLGPNPIRLDGGPLRLMPVTIRAANDFVTTHHRHLGPVAGARLAIGIRDAWGLCGVALVGRPVAAALDDGQTLEVNRLATDGAPNGCTMLYGASWRAARAIGYRRLITYTRADEIGSSLRAAGFVREVLTRGGQWSRAGRPRTAPASDGQKVRWGIQCENDYRR